MSGLINRIDILFFNMKRALKQAFKPKTMYIASSPDTSGQAMRQLIKK